MHLKVKVRLYLLFFFFLVFRADRSLNPRSPQTVEHSSEAAHSSCRALDVSTCLCMELKRDTTKVQDGSFSCSPTPSKTHKNNKFKWWRMD